MTRKTVSIAIPKPVAPLNAADAPVAPAAARPEAHADHWVSRAEPKAAPERPIPLHGSLHVDIPRDPSLFDVMKVGFILPQMVYWQWTLGAVERNLRLLKRR